MPTRRRLRGVLAGFLGTFTSRYSDYGGYWLFGFLVGGPAVLTFDLIGPPPPPRSGSSEGIAHHLARKKFAEQLRKSGLPPASIRSAVLTIERPSATVTEGGGSGGPRRGFNLHLRVTLVADTGQTFARDQIVFAAPHDPQRELRSGRAFVH